MNTDSPSLSRRRFCRLLVGVATAAALPALGGCGNFQPLPFTTGATVSAPHGCSELRKRDPQGDC